MLHLPMTIFISVAGILVAFMLISLLKKSRARIRSLRLQILAERSTIQNTRLSQLLVAENAKLIGKGIDQGALFLNAGHKTVSDLTYGLLELFPATRGKAREFREKHMQISEGITHVFRAVNKHVGERIAEGIKNPRHAKKKKKPARPAARRRLKKLRS